MLRTGLIALAVFFSIGAASEQSARLSDDYAIAALRAVVHAQTFGILTENSAKERELFNEADVQANTEAELKSLEQIERILLADGP